MKSKSQARTKKDVKLDTSEGLREPSSHVHKRRKAEPSNSVTSANSSAHHETFEKRARHKTREDRYEPKKGGRKFDKDDREKRPRKKREKKGDKKKTAKKAGEDLVNNFSSKSIAQERLTVSTLE